jgi:DNA-binding SARP family transcriptional activator
VLGLSVIARMQGKYADAVVSLRKLIQNDPKNYRLYLELSQCHIAMGDKQKAIDTLADFQRLGIRNVYVQDAVAKLQRA